MKRYAELTQEQRGEAVEKAAGKLLGAILEGGLHFNDSLNHDDLQARIDKAIAKAEAMRTPWFAHEYIMETCQEEIVGMATCDAEDAYYPEPGELTIGGIA